MDDFGRLDFDQLRRTISLGERQTRLTTHQTALLMHLAQCAEAVSAADLIAAGLFLPNATRSRNLSTLLRQ